MTRREILVRLAREARPYYPRLATAMTMGVVAGVLSIVPPLAFRIIINDVLVPLPGRPPDLKALYLALGSDLDRARARQRAQSTDKPTSRRGAVSISLPVCACGFSIGC